MIGTQAVPKPHLLLGLNDAGLTGVSLRPWSYWEHPERKTLNAHRKRLAGLSKEIKLHALEFTVK